MKLKETFQKALDSCYPDATTMFFTDRDGVLVMSVGEELRGRQQVIACHQNSIEQVKKLGMGGHKTSVFFYKESQVIVSTMGPHLTLFIVAEEMANTGLLMQMRNKLTPLAREIEIAIPDVTIDREAEAEAEAKLAAMNLTLVEPSKPFPEIPKEEPPEPKPASAPWNIETTQSRPKPSSSRYRLEEEEEPVSTYFHDYRTNKTSHSAEEHEVMPPWRWHEGTNKQSPFDKVYNKQTRSSRYEPPRDDSELS